MNFSASMFVPLSHVDANSRLGETPLFQRILAIGRLFQDGFVRKAKWFRGWRRIELGQVPSAASLMSTLRRRNGARLLVQATANLGARSRNA
jgi:hypothetical protein